MSESHPLRAIEGASAAMRRVRARVAALAPLQVPVLVTGEPGTGHDRVARALHAAGGAQAPFRVVRCGETDRRPDRLAGAVVYLDRVERLAPSDQSRWQTALASAGRAGAAPRRVIASTCEDLAARAREGVFLPGLARDLGRFAIRLPPLRERPGDVARLVPPLVERAGAALGRERCRVTPAAIACLRARRWPGNVRELAEVVERLVAFAGEGEITAALVADVLGELPGSVPSLRAERDRRQREELLGLLDECEGNLAEVGRRLALSRGAVVHRARKFGLLPGARAPGARRAPRRAPRGGGGPSR